MWGFKQQGFHHRGWTGDARGAAGSAGPQRARGASGAPNIGEWGTQHRQMGLNTSLAAKKELANEVVVQGYCYSIVAYSVNFLAHSTSLVTSSLPQSSGQRHEAAEQYPGHTEQFEELYDTDWKKLLTQLNRPRKHKPPTDLLQHQGAPSWSMDAFISHDLAFFYHQATHVCVCVAFYVEASGSAATSAGAASASSQGSACGGK